MEDQPRDEDGRFASSGSSSGSSSADLSDALYRKKDAADRMRTSRGDARSAAMRDLDAANAAISAHFAQQRAADSGTAKRDRMVAQAAKVYGEGSPQHLWAQEHDWG